MKFKRMASLLVSLALATSVSCATVFASGHDKVTALSSEQILSGITKATEDGSVRFDYSYYTNMAASTKSKVTKTYTAAVGSAVTLDDLNLPVIKEGNAITAGWSTVKNETIYENQTEAEKANGFVKPSDEISYSVAEDTIYTLYPVFRSKTEDELSAEAASEAKAEKIAVDGNGIEISAAKVNINIKALSGDEVSNALKASGANATTSALYDITITDDNGDKVKMLEGKSIEVTLERPKIDGNVSFKLYHIENGKAEEVKIVVNNDSIVFNADSFSPYVLTWKISSGISGSGNPITGDDFNALPIIIIAGVALAAVVAVLVIKKVRDGKSDD